MGEIGWIPTVADECLDPMTFFYPIWGFLVKNAYLNFSQLQSDKTLSK